MVGIGAPRRPWRYAVDVPRCRAFFRCRLFRAALTLFAHRGTTPSSGKGIRHWPPANEAGSLFGRLADLQERTLADAAHPQ